MRFVASLGTASAVALVVALAAPATAQAPYSPPKTWDGQPDLQGVWQVMNTAAWNIQDHNAQLGVPAGRGVVEGNELPYQPAALAKRDQNRANRRTADPESKCFLPGIPRIMYMPYPFRIVQSQGQVNIFYEYIHSIRNIYMNSEHPKGPIEWWMGDSRGRWEGNTLVIDVTNFTPKTDYQGSRENLHLVERFTRIDADNMEYVVTIDDPTTWEQPWTVKVELARQDAKANAIYDEPRCHDGNLALKNMLIGAREDDKAFAEGRGPDPATMCYLLCGTGNPEYAKLRMAGRGGGAGPAPGSPAPSPQR